ncbi:MAG: hypothetical protein WBL23_18320 [Salinisphaera sp.]|uniref:hypothetical protein n=1 Tax=Salinisphaera sp. TaxID=1914330 RepID=UPI003C7B0E6C
MRIGVVCEGVTDFIVIREFLGAALTKRNIAASIFSIQPPPDRTKGGGCTEVLNWLIRMPPKRRRDTFLRGGLFQSNDPKGDLDFLIIQMDSDVLSDDHFIRFVGKHGVVVSQCTSVADKSAETTRIIEAFSDLNILTQVDIDKHVFAAAVDAIESWCVAAYENRTHDPEALTGQDLYDAFGSVLARSLGREPADSYDSMNKKPKTRQRFCELRKNSNHLERQCTQFVKLLQDIT